MVLIIIQTFEVSAMIFLIQKHEAPKELENAGNELIDGR
jgi:hypothetical protein